MSKLLKLREQAETLKAEGRGILDATERTETQEARLTEIDANLEKLATEIAAEEQAASRALAYAGSADADRIVVGEDRSRLDPSAGFRDLGEFAVAVHQAGQYGSVADNRLMAAPTTSNTHVTQGSTDGEGYLVPEQFSNRVFELVFADEDLNLLNRVDSEPTNSTSVRMVADETTPWGATGVQAYWGSELGQMTKSKINVDPRRVEVHKCYAFSAASEEELNDAPLLANRIERKASQAIRWKANDAIIAGNGVGKPKGWRNSGAQVTVAKESGQAADTVVAANVAKMYARLLPGSHSRAFWMANPDVMPQLMTMTLGDQPIWTGPNQFVDAPGGILLGRPVFFSEHSETVGDKNDIELVDPMGYYAAIRQGITAAQSMHLYFDYDTQAFRWTFRMGGQGHLSAAVTPNKGSATKSHFITLAARA